MYDPIIRLWNDFSLNILAAIKLHLAIGTLGKRSIIESASTASSLLMNTT